MPNYLDFLVAFDDHIRDSSLGYVMYGNDLYGVAERAGLAAPGDQSPARWIGELVAVGCISHGPPGRGDPRPIPRGAYSPDELSRFTEYRITTDGRAEADRIRRQRREELSDIALGFALPNLLRVGRGEHERAAISGPFAHLRAALDAGHYADAVGAAKELVEAACKTAIRRAAMPVPARADLPALYKAAVAANGDPDPGSDLGRSLATAVQRLAELRNDVGAGHGHATPPRVTARDASLAATAACGLSLFILDQPR